MFIIVYSSFIILNYEFLYLLNLCIIFELCIYYFKFMLLIYVFILFELCLLFLNSCIYSIHVFIIFEFIYLLFLTIKLFLCC